MTSSVEMESVTKCYRPGVPVLDRLTLDYRGVGAVGYLGPNGAGKSTTLKLLVGLLRPTDGRVRLNGHDPVREREAALWDVGAVIENPVPYPSETVFDALNRVGLLRGLDREGIDDAIDRCEEEIRLPPLGQRCGALSKGQRQRVALAAARVGDPTVLLLDEPTDGMDPAERIHVRGVLRELRRDHLLVLSSHLMADVTEVCDRLVFIDRGRILRQGATESIVGGAESRLLEVEFATGVQPGALAALSPWVDEVLPVGPGRYRLRFDGRPEHRGQIAEALVKVGPVLSFTSAYPALETAYLEVVGAGPRP